MIQEIQVVRSKPTCQLWSINSSDSRHSDYSLYAEEADEDTDRYMGDYEWRIILEESYIYVVGK